MAEWNDLVSTKIGLNKNITFHPLTKDDLWMDKPLTSMKILSAYTDVDFIETIVNKLTRKSSKVVNQRKDFHFTLYLDYHASHYQNCQSIKKRLDKIAKKIKEHCNESSGIFLVKKGSLFHSKLILLESQNLYRIILGSANFTKAAFEKNEEIAFFYEANSKRNINLKKQCLDYFQHLDNGCSSKPKFVYKLPLKREPALDSKIEFRDFFMAGRLYYENKENKPFQFQIKGLPDNISSIHPLLKASKKSISLIDLLENQDFGLGESLDEKTSAKSTKEEDPNTRWKKYCILTSYGYWCPQQYLSKIKEAIELRSSENKAKYKKLKNIINDKNKQELLKQKFIAFINIVQRKTNEVIEELNTAEDWSRWIKKKCKKLENEDFFNRICSDIEDCTVPDVWNDIESSFEFEDSFLENLLYQYQRESGNQSQNLVAKAIRHMLIQKNIELTKIMNNDDKKSLKKLICSNYHAISF